MKQRFTQINVGKISNMLDEMIEMDKLKTKATDVTCKSCYRGEYTTKDERCEFCNEVM